MNACLCRCAVFALKRAVPGTASRRLSVLSVHPTPAREALMNSPTMSAPKFSKRLRLLGWALVHKVPAEQRDLTNLDLAKAARWFGGIPVEKDQELGAVWRLWIRGVLDRRARRRGWLERHGSVPKGWTPPRGWETRTDVRPPVKAATPSKRESNKAAWRAMLGPTCRELAAQRREQRAAIKARIEALCIADGRDPKTGKRIKAA